LEPAGTAGSLPHPPLARSSPAASW
jgi:hypothetical protein